MYIWNYVFQIFMIRYWDDNHRQIPVFRGELEGEALGDFQWTESGINDIILSTNQGLSDRELMGLLLHEMCHHVVYEKYGYKLAPHGVEWQEEMKVAGFTGKINRWTDGCNRFTEEEYHEIMDLVEGI